MNALSLLLLASTIVLRTGDRIAVDEPPRTENGVVVFRASGQLYSVPEIEIDAEATRLASAAGEKKEEDSVRRLRVSDEERRRLLAELEKNHSGTPAQIPESLLRPEPPPTRADVVEQTREEWEWRRQARAFEEGVRQAKEELAMLEEEIDRLRGEIRSFVSLGYKPAQFTQTTRLAYAIERIPRAELDVRRAERAYDQFRDDARKQGILPGWLR
jgi:hypothetical protein